MKSEIEQKDVDEEDLDDQEDDSTEATVVMSEDTFDDSDDSMEVNVDALVAALEKAEAADLQRKKEVRRRLEELAEKRSLEDTFAIDFDDD